MAPFVTEALLWLFVISFGIACGAGLYETRIALGASSPSWRGHGFRRSPCEGEKTTALACW
jgi:hypothetical protein